MDLPHGIRYAFCHTVSEAEKEARAEIDFA
jgi:hypothetical protein